MTKIKNTKRSLLLSGISLLLCASMFVGSTFAWFTDTVSSDRNIIQSGNLDVELYYALTAEEAKAGEWTKVTAETDVFGYTLWEPGHTRVAYFKVANEGSLALKYQLTADVFNETAGKNKLGENGETFLLSDYLYTAILEDENATRDDILKLKGTNFKGSIPMSEMGELKAKGVDENGNPNKSEEVIALAIWMPTSVGNEANHDGKNIPKIEFGINLVATQLDAEIDSFGPDYDKDAEYTIEVSTFEELQDIMNRGGYAKLTADIDASQLTPKNQRLTIPAGVTATIDLNGHTFTSKDGGSPNWMAIFADQNSNLTINDSVGGGKIVSSCYGIYVKQNAKVTMNGGTLIVDGNGQYDMGVVLYSGEFVMNGGSIEAKDGIVASNYYKNTDATLPVNKITLGTFATITASNLEISKCEGESDEALDTVIVDNRATAVSTVEELSTAIANGGDVKIAYTGSEEFKIEDNTSITGDVTISFLVPGTSFAIEEDKALTVSDGGSLTINNAVINNVGERDDSAIVVDGGTLSLGEGTVIENIAQEMPDAGVIRIADDESKLVLDGAEITGCDNNGKGSLISIGAGAEMVISEGTNIQGNTITLTGNANGKRNALIKVSGTLTMDGGSISDNEFAHKTLISVENGKFVINGGEITGNKFTGTDASSIIYLFTKTSTVEMNGGTIANNDLGADSDSAVFNTFSNPSANALVVNAGTVTNNTANGVDSFAYVDGFGSISISSDATVSGLVSDPWGAGTKDVTELLN